jgi:hypothetical protein
MSAWRRGDEPADLGPRRVIRIDDAPHAVRVDGSPPPIVLRPLVTDECDLAVLTFEFPPNYVGKVHWHPADTVYVVRRGQFIVDGEGTYEVGDLRWVKAGTPYGPERAGPDGCEVLLIAKGTFPLPTHDPLVEPPPR